MNVNPFSYLIEKLKGKVDRHNDWAYNTDLNTLKSDGLYHLGTGQTNVPSGIDANWSTLYVNGNGVETASQTFISRNNVVYTRVCISGTWGSWNELALKSDITTTTENFNGGAISALGYNASVLSLTVPSGYSLKSYMIETTGAYGTYINFYVTNGVLNATNCHPSNSADCTGKITCIWQR